MTAKEVLERSRTVAVVGLSRDPGKAAHAVPAGLRAAGFRIIPVNPHATELLGETAYARLEDVPSPVDLVVVFRPAREAPEIARQAVAMGAKALWLQTGIRSDEARSIAEGAGLDYVEDRCTGVERAINSIRKSSYSRKRSASILSLDHRPGASGPHKEWGLGLGGKPMHAACSHLAHPNVTETDVGVCAECVAQGSGWVHLRLCLECGHVGCCDSSPNRHATKHFRSSSHPAVRSIEPGDNWAYCYVDDLIQGL